MAAINFPDAPTNGQIFESGGMSWTYVAGIGWTLNSAIVEAGSGFTFIADTMPLPVNVGDTWFDSSTGASGGTSWVAVEEGPAGASEKVWVQFAPGIGGSPVPPREIWYRQVTTPVTISNQIGAQQFLIPYDQLTFDGSTTVMLEYFATSVHMPKAIDRQTVVEFWDFENSLGFSYQAMNVGANNMVMPVYAAKRITPTSGIHWYSVRAWVSDAGYPAVYQADVGGPSKMSPMFLRITRV